MSVREVGLPTVPVYILPASAFDDTAEAVARTVHHIVSNDYSADPPVKGSPKWSSRRGGLAEWRR